MAPLHRRAAPALPTLPFLLRYFARALNPGGGLEPPPRELNAIRQARVETSRFLAELLEFAQTRLLEYARLVAERGRDGGDDDDDDDFGESGEGLMGSCVWELQERGRVVFGVFFPSFFRPVFRLFCLFVCSSFRCPCLAPLCVFFLIGRGMITSSRRACGR